MKQYSFLNVSLLVNGVEIGGYDEGDDVITLERLADSAAHVISADGIMSVSLSADRSGTLTFRLNQTSSSNAFLSALVSSQENGLFIPVFMQLKDVVGNDLGIGTQGYIPRPSMMTRGVNSNAQEWAIVVESLSLIYGPQ